MLRALVGPLVMRSYAPRGRRLSLSCRIRLIYGLLGFAFLCFTASWSILDRSGYAESLVPPTAWYWKWVPRGVNGSSGETAGTSANSKTGPIIESEESQLLRKGVQPQAVIGSQLSASWGTDGQGRSLRWVMGEGAADYLAFGILASLIGALGGVAWGLLAEWPTRQRIPLPHQPSWWRHLFVAAAREFRAALDNVPKYILLLALFAIGRVSMPKLTMAFAVFLLFGAAGLFQSVTSTYLSSEPYLYALEMGLSRRRIILIHLIRREITPYLIVQLPFMLSLFILYESTLTWLGWYGSDGSWGSLIKTYMPHENWCFWIPIISLLIVVSALYVLGDALRELLLEGKA